MERKKEELRETGETQSRWRSCLEDEGKRGGGSLGAMVV